MAYIPILGMKAAFALRQVNFPLTLQRQYSTGSQSHMVPGTMEWYIIVYHETGPRVIILIISRLLVLVIFNPEDNFASDSGLV